MLIKAKKQSIAMNNAITILEIPFVKTAIEKGVNKMPDGKAKEIMKNKVLSSLLLGNILNEIGIVSVQIKKE